MASNTLSLSISFSASSPHSTPYPTKLLRTIPSPSLSFPFRNHAVLNSLQQRHFSVKKKKQLLGLARSVEEETQIIPEEQQETSSSSPDQLAVSVPVSPSDILTMFFQAEGVMNEAIIPNLTRALEETEGISNLKVQVVEGIASVELTKQTTVQATGVASSLLETIQGTGFKLQTLNLSFEDEEELVA
ncbi:EG2771 [Fagus crenata]